MTLFWSNYTIYSVNFHKFWTLDPTDITNTIILRSVLCIISRACVSKMQTLGHDIGTGQKFLVWLSWGWRGLKGIERDLIPCKSKSHPILLLMGITEQSLLREAEQPFHQSCTTFTFHQLAMVHWTYKAFEKTFHTTCKQEHQHLGL